MTNDSSFEVSTDQTRLDIPMIYRFLSEQSTWAVGISRPVVERAIENSLCFGGYLDGRQIAFARVITDFSTFANLVDPDGVTLDCVVDVNPNKQGGFIPGTGHSIVAPEALSERNIRNVILMNPNYRLENLQLLRSTGSDANLLNWSE